MAGLYPNLQENFASEDICPVCILKMPSSTRYTCNNKHVLCSQCKQFYNSCPTCFTPLFLETNRQHMPMPMPMPQPYDPNPYPASAPALEEFFTNERNTDCPELFKCAYFAKGCKVRYPRNLEAIHLSRCPYGTCPEEETICIVDDIENLNMSDSNAVVDCKYKDKGCKVKALLSKISCHENKCQYKAESESGSEIGECEDGIVVYTNDDENTIVECEFRKHGCKVKMPLRSLMNHLSKCPYNVEGVAIYASDDEYSDSSEPDENGLVKCRNSVHGCVVRVPPHRKAYHEERCSYGPDDCNIVYCTESVDCPSTETEVCCRYRNRGCKVILLPAAKLSHENKCNYR